jgi:hypothetical protein
VDEAYHEQRLDPALAKLVPESVEVIKVGAVPARVSRLAGVGDIALRAYPHLARGIRKILSRQDVDVVMITGSPYYPMLLAPMVKREFGASVVLDFQDPWVSAWGAAQPRWSKRGASHALAVRLEPVALKSADFITSVSEQQNVEMAARYPWLDATRMASMPIGGDPDDYAAAQTITRAGGRQSAREIINFTYVGTVWDRAAGVVRELIGAISELQVSRPRLAERLRFNFIGTSARTDGHQMFQVAPLAEAAGVAHLVFESPARIPYLDALSEMASADVLLLVGSDEPHYTASKIYPSLMSCRPFLSIFHRSSSAHEVLTRAGGGLALAFETPDELHALVPTIAEGLERLATRAGSCGRPDPAAYAAFTAQSIAERFAEAFQRAMQPHRSPS